MTYQKDILSAVLREMEQTRTARGQELAERRQEVYAQSPRIRQIDVSLQSTAAFVLRAALEAGDDPAQAIERLREQNLSLQAERKQLLNALGLPESYLELQYDCPVCSDMGYLGSEPCECLKKRYAKRLTEQLSAILPIQNQNFESFRLDYYSSAPDARLGVSPRSIMESNYNKCLQYAHHFSRNSPNLLLYGSAGLGKTFLSTSIAKTVSENGFSVVYDTAINVLGCYETVKFGSGDTSAAQAAIRRCEGADLFIMDDLGTELSTSFTTSAFYQLLNGRLMTRRPMILNTNLLPKQLESQYSAAIASRLLGEFTPLRFLGEDIRQLRRRSPQAL